MLCYLCHLNRWSLQSRSGKKRVTNSIDTKENMLKHIVGSSSQANVITVFKEKDKGNRAILPLWS